MGSVNASTLFLVLVTPSLKQRSPLDDSGFRLAMYLCEQFEILSHGSSEGAYIAQNARHMDDENDVTIIFLDFCEVFDVVIYKFLCTKMATLGFFHSES